MGEVGKVNIQLIDDCLMRYNGECTPLEFEMTLLRIAPFLECVGKGDVNAFNDLCTELSGHPLSLPVPQYTLESVDQNRTCGKTKLIDIPEGEFFCKTCGKNSIVYDAVKCDKVCIDCGLTSYAPQLQQISGIFPASEVTNFEMVKTNVYTRINNLKALLRNLQGYPSPLSESAMKFIQQNKGQHFTLVTLRQAMKRAGLSKFYCNIFMIAQMIVPTYKCVSLTPKEYMRIICRFKLYVTAFEMMKKRVRKNFVGYQFALIQVCRELRMTKVLPHLSLPKNKATLKAQSMLWIQLNKVVRPKILETNHLNNLQK